MLNLKLYRLVIFFLVFLLAGGVAFADFEAGLEAYENKEYQVAYQEWLPLAEQGHRDAQYFLGYMHYHELGVPYDIAETVKWYRLAAEQGSADAQNSLGVLYQFGEGVEQSHEEAAKWYQRAADQGDMYGFANLGHIYTDGLGVPQDDVKAFELFHTAAELGDAVSQYYVGYFYFAGIGVRKDIEAALEWYGKSAENGDLHAQAELGHMYLVDDEVEQDVTKAAKWLARAAEQGVSDAQYSLGTLYMYGAGVEKDLRSAKYCLELSAEQGNPNAPNVLAIIEGYEEDVNEGFESVDIDVSDVTALIPRGRVRVTRAFQAYENARELIDIRARLASALKTNPRALDTVLNTEDGEPLPYKEWYNITEEEYQLVLQPKWTYVPFEKGRLRVREISENVFHISGGNVAPNLEVTVDLNTMSVETPFGVLTEVSRFDISDDDLPGQGPARQGYSWVGYDFPTRISFVLAKLPESNQHLIYYNMNTNGNPTVPPQTYTLLSE